VLPARDRVVSAAVPPYHSGPITGPELGQRNSTGVSEKSVADN